MFEETTRFPCSTVAQAARAGKLDEIKRLIEEDHPIDVADNRGWRPIHEAAHGDYVDCLQYLLEFGQTDANWQSFEGITPLHLACEQRSTQAVEILLDHGSDPNLYDHMETFPILTAVRSNDAELVRLLMGHGARVNVQLYCGTSPLHQAAAEGQSDMVELLLDSGAKLDIREEYDITPIFSAAQYGQTSCLELLLNKAKETGEDHLVDSPADDGATPLYLAAQEGHVQCVKLLLSHGANPNLGPKHPKALPLHAALQFNHVQIVREIVRHTDQEALSKCDLSPFYFATSHKDTKCTKALLEAGISPNLRHKTDDEGFEPRVLRYCVPISMYSQHISPLVQLAILRHPLENAEVLLDAGASLDAHTAYEVPPLLAALEVRNLDLAEMLIRRGAKVNIYHPMIMGNMTVLLTRYHWKAFNLVLHCGAEVESLFNHRPIGHSDTHGAAMQLSDTADAMSLNDFESESHELRLGMLRSPITLWRNLAESRVPNGHLSASGFMRRVLFFTGNVSLDPRLAPYMESKKDWEEILSTVDAPRSLTHLCRLAIRRQMSPAQLLEQQAIKTLPLPEPVIDFLLYKELDT